MDTGWSNNSKLTVLMRPMHTYAELTCARRPTRDSMQIEGGMAVRPACVEAWPFLLWDVAEQATERHGVGPG
jgi:hypothetical protein